MADNRGAQRLRGLKLSQAAIARGLQVKDSSVVSRWFRGERTPDTKQRASLEDAYAIGWRLWDEEIPEASVEEPTPAAEPTGTDG